MKGTDLSQQELEVAAAFIHRVLKSRQQTIADDSICENSFGDIVRLVAWYGHIRYEAALHNVVTRQYVREEFPKPAVLPTEIRQQILEDPNLSQPGEVGPKQVA